MDRKNNSSKVLIQKICYSQQKISAGGTKSSTGGKNNSAWRKSNSADGKVIPPTEK